MFQNDQTSQVSHTELESVLQSYFFPFFGET